MMLTRILLFLFFWSFIIKVQAQAPVNDDIKTATPIKNITVYCSNDAAFTSINATPSGYRKGFFWNSEGKDIWYSFTAIGTDITATVTGQSVGNSNTLVNPLIAFYTYKDNVLTEQIGSMTSESNITMAYKGGLVIGETYYLRISADNNATGSFKLCVNSYNPPNKPGQDFTSASYLCSKDSFTELKVTGAGPNNHEAAGTCLSVESNSAWYTWIAANNGTLGFTITPTAVTDDIDWVLFDLGPSTSAATPSSVNAIRCAAGSGVDCSPRYYITGANSASADLTEHGGCSPDQDGFVKAVDMIEGHQYALLIDNFSNRNNGFSLAFDGNGEFAGPKSAINIKTENACLSTQKFIFTADASNYSSLKWSFGEGASIANASTTGPVEITYATPGTKTVVLEAFSVRGCRTVSSYSFYVALKPDKPIISANRTNFCLGTTMELSIAEVPDATYQWTGPANFSDSTAVISVPITDFAQAGDYAVTVKVGNCYSEMATINIPTIVRNPVADFKTDPIVPGKFAAPVPITFLNHSRNADYFEWSFGDDEISSDYQPTHVYQKKGNYTVILKAFTNNGCVDIFTLHNLMVLDGSELQIPNSFSPNGDGINDLLNINVSNLKRFNFKIFNRYGDEVFFTTNIFDSWDGTWRNKPVPVGAYYYVLNGTNVFNQEVRFTGSITLIR
ncbi:gliding motility-associated C-terminal domain-containing protein [Pedobacter riviphilus]|uniref:Gliding motility-associated C-terminal domain-containing protein n=1 Tax=Pedobacter riviphilus TaxID=2766984 RepID=A0ABX6TNX8_9SPHI|nr:gliding motility-associated C-terminal domain-containing protein [Pedobacter riviphilus]QNR87002.1 gliding motility-associated C-terminal domain-containing protein [Pedobacter riviphilus]